MRAVDIFAEHERDVGICKRNSFVAGLRKTQFYQFWCVGIQCLGIFQNLDGRQVAGIVLGDKINVVSGFRLQAGHIERSGSIFLGVKGTTLKRIHATLDLQLLVKFSGSSIIQCGVFDRIVRTVLDDCPVDLTILIDGCFTGQRSFVDLADARIIVKEFRRGAISSGDRNLFHRRVVDAVGQEEVSIVIR